MDQLEALYNEGKRSARIMPISLSPLIIRHPLARNTSTALCLQSHGLAASGSPPAPGLLISITKLRRSGPDRRPRGMRSTFGTAG
jgi:hypothetical protein